MSDIFLKMNEVTQSLQGKLLMVFVAKEKIQAFKRKLEFRKTSVYHFNIDVFPILKKFSGEISGNIYKGDLFDIL